MARRTGSLNRYGVPARARTRPPHRERGEGAYLHDQGLRVSAINSIAACSFNPAGLHLPEVRPHLPKLMELMQQSWSVRSYGGALDACLLAAGKLEIWFVPKAEVWDL